MSSDSNKDRLVRNEQILRQSNVAKKNGLKRFFRNDSKLKSTPIAFVCECSALSCGESISLSINNYEKIHNRRDRFVIAKGHEVPEVEKTVADEGDFRIVEKFQLSPN